MTAHFYNCEGYSLIQPVGLSLSSIWRKFIDWIKGFFRVPIYRFTLDKERPLTYVDKDGIQYRPSSSYLTDFGSVPRPIQPIPGFGKDDHLLPVLFHDSEYTYQGGWVSRDGGVTWKFESMERDFVDQKLHDSLLVDPGQYGPASEKQADIYYQAVKRFGKKVWNDRAEKNKK